MLPLRLLFGDHAEILRESNFQVLLLSTLLPVLGSSLLSPVLDSLIDPFGTSAVRIGLMVSAFTAPAIVMIPVAGVLADRYGRKSILVLSLVLFGAAGTAIALTTDYRIVLALRLLQGVAFGGINPVIITSIGDLYAGAREATGQGLRFTASGLSGTVFPLVSGVVVLLSWRYPFLLYALALPVAAVVWVWFDEPTKRDAPATGDGGVEGTYHRALLRLVSRPHVLAVLVARGMPNVVWIGFVTYNSILVVRLMGGSPPEAGLLFAAGSLVFASSASQAGRITSWFSSRSYPLVGANVCLGLGLLVVLFAPGIGVAGVGITLAGAGFGILLSLYRSLMTGLAPESLRAGLVGVGEAGGRLTSTLTPIAMGAIIAVATPTIGLARAVQLAGVGSVAVGVGGGLLCLLIADVSPTPVGE